MNNRKTNGCAAACAAAIVFWTFGQVAVADPSPDPAAAPAEPATSEPSAAPAATEAPTPPAEPAATPTPPIEPTAAPTEPMASTPPPAEPSAEPAAQSAQVQAPSADANIAPPPSGKGQIVFFRKGGLVGAAIVYKVREGEAALGTLSPGHYFVSVVDPGRHTYTVHSEVKDNLTLEVDDGETYYVQGTVQMGMLVGRPAITPSDQHTFDMLYPKLKRATN